MSNYERRGSILLPIFVGYAVGSIVGNIIHDAVTPDPDDRVRDVQVAYEQIYDQLDPAHSVGDLILNDKTHTFTFVEGQLVCTGSYEGEKEQAQVVGDLSCSQPVSVR